MDTKRISTSLIAGGCGAGLNIIVNVFRTFIENNGDAIAKVEINDDFLLVFLGVVAFSYIFSK